MPLRALKRTVSRETKLTNLERNFAPPTSFLRATSSNVAHRWEYVFLAVREMPIGIAEMARARDKVPFADWKVPLWTEKALDLREQLTPAGAKCEDAWEEVQRDERHYGVRQS